MSTVGELRNALNQMHRRACGDESVVYMSVPADRSRDADLMLSDAIDVENPSDVDDDEEPKA